MKKMILGLLLTVSFNTWSACNVYITSPGYHHESGHTIQFNFGPMLSERGYSLVVEESKANFLLDIDGEERQGKYLPQAFTQMIFRSTSGQVLESETSVRCYTQACGVSDFIKSFNKSYRAMAKKLASCKE